MCIRVIIGKQSSHSCVLIVAAVRRVVASSSLTQSLKGIATAGIVIIPYVTGFEKSHLPRTITNV